MCYFTVALSFLVLLLEFWFIHSWFVSLRAQSFLVSSLCFVILSVFPVMYPFTPHYMTQRVNVIAEL